MDGGFGDDVNGGRADAVSGAGSGGPDEPGGRPSPTEQNDHGRVPVHDRVLESGEAASAEEITQCSVVGEEPAYGRCEAIQYAQRDRERDTKRYNSIIKSMCNSYK